MIDILILFTSHCIADFPMQGEFITKWKSKSIYVLLCHCAIYTLTVLFGLYVVTLRHGVPYTNVDWSFLASLLFYTHFIIDYIKCSYRTKLYDKNEIDIDVDFDGREQVDPEIWKRDKLIFYADQISHIVIVMAILACI